MPSPLHTSSALPDEIRESVALGSVSVADQQAALSNLLFANLINNVNISQQNAVSNQQAMSQLSLAITGKLANLIANLSPLQAAAVASMTSGNGLTPGPATPDAQPQDQPGESRET